MTNDIPTVDEIIEKYSWACETHGPLEEEHITVSVDGFLVCKLCVAANLNSPAEIDPTISIQDIREDDYTVEV